jgi:D-alanyl-D-alanine carboxypeptidase/D-alanyl-D-alanine-endopeptidase (penicillin-binding protein 4)
MAPLRRGPASLILVPLVPYSRLRLAALAALAAFAALLSFAPGALALTRQALVNKTAKAMKKAGPYSGALVRDLTTGEVLFELRPGADRIPASVAKLYTTAAALRRMGPSTRLNTDALASGTLDEDGRLDGDLFIRGGGDPTLGASDVATLAGRVGASGIRSVSGSVIGDESRFDTRRGGSGWGYSPWLGGSIGALAVSRGWGDGGPGISAARSFARAVRARGVRVRGRTKTGGTPDGARRLGRVSSPTVAELSRLVNSPSDNFMAEVMLKELGARFGAAGTTTAGAAVARSVASGFGASPRIADGSGLSRSNSTSPRDVMALIIGMRRGDDRDAFEGSLAVAGRTGTLASRMRGTRAAGNCRAKTGTLSNVSTLAGTCRSASGHTIAFALMMNAIAPARGRVLQDSIARSLARYAG